MGTGTKFLAGAALAAVATCATAIEIVVIVHPSAPKLAKDEVEDVFLGRVARAIPLDLADAQPVRTVFYAKATGRSLSQVRTVWSRVIFTGKGLTPKEYPDAASVKRIVAANPRAIGYIEKSAVDASVKVAFELD